MFDDLHDPDPPLADMAALNRVAKRAEQMRRRRALFIGTGAGALVVVATVATIAIMNSGDADGKLVIDTPSSSSPLDSTPDSATSTTVVVGLTTTTLPAVAPTTATTDVVTDSTEAVVETTVVETTVEETTTTAAATTTTTVPIVTGPIVAIDANGDAVLVSLDGANVVLFDGPDPDDPPGGEGETSGVDGVAITPDRSRAFIGLCCEPVAGNLLQTTPPAMATINGNDPFGHAPAMAPGGGVLARIVYDSLVVSDLAVNALASTPEDFDVGTTYDLAWSDDQHLLALRLGPGGTDLRVFAFAGGSLTPGASTTVVPASPTRGATFAGRSAGVIYLAGVTTGALTAYDSTTLAPLPDRNIAVADAVSAWVESGVVRWVDGSRQLHVGDVVVPGQYLWVR